MNTCKTCKWWRETPWFFVRQPKSQTRGICTHERIGEGNGDPEPDGLQYAYNEGVATYTGPDFGCVHHDPKEPPNWWQLDNVRVTIHEDEVVYELREDSGARRVRREKLTPEQKREIAERMKSGGSAFAGLPDEDVS